MRPPIFVLGLLCMACGSPFTAAIHSADGSLDDSFEPMLDGSHGERSSNPDSGKDADANHRWRDSGDKDGPDGPEVDSTGPAPDADHDSGCTSPVNGTGACGGIPATEYCISSGGGTFSGTVPGPCECESTYTCACIEANVTDPCNGHGTFTGCIIDGTVPLMTCS
jgi:hypothetical protein